MLLNIAAKALNLINTNKMIVKRLLIAIAPFLLKTHLNSFKCMSFESLLARFTFNPKSEFLENAQVLEEKSPYETIFIKFEGSKDFELRIKDKISKLKVQTKYIKISRIDSSEHYFVKIYLSEGSSSFYNVYPLMNYQPITELAFLTRSVFNHRLLFRLSDLFYTPFENAICLTLKDNDQSILKLCHLIRYFSNINSHIYGLYYYVPLATGFIKIESLAKFIILVCIILGFDLKLDFDVISTISNVSNFILSPTICISLVNSNQKCIYLALFTMINFKFAFIFGILCYTIELIKEIKILKSSGKYKVIKNE